MSRRETTELLTRAAKNYYIKKKFAVFEEFGVGSYGKRRLDLLCMNNKCSYVGIEIKSGKADYVTDSKWREYLSYVNKLYILIPPKLAESSFFEQIQRDTKPHGVGIMTLTPIAGKITVIQNAKSQKVADDVMMKMLIKMAWRGGESVRTRKKNARKTRSI